MLHSIATGCFREKRARPPFPLEAPNAINAPFLEATGLQAARSTHRKQRGAQKLRRPSARARHVAGQMQGAPNRDVSPLRARAHQVFAASRNVRMY